MKPEDRYHRFVRWSDEDQCYIGYCPDLYFGGGCHGDQEEQTYAQTEGRTVNQSLPLNFYSAPVVLSHENGAMVG